MMTGTRTAALAVCIGMTVVPATAQAPRDLLAQASFSDHDKATALRRVETVLATLRQDGGVEAGIMRATALGYRAKLTGSRSDLSGSRKLYEASAAAQPRNAEAQLGIGAWHLGVVNKFGGMVGRVFGANRSIGNAAMDRAVALGGDHAFYPGIAALFRIKGDAGDARGRQLAEQASRAGTATALDRIMQRAATAVLGELRAGRKGQAQALAQRLLPLGGIAGVN